MSHKKKKKGKRVDDATDEWVNEAKAGFVK
jgi:hypothetical protein